ncbi:MAG TPA: sugar ABC transporter permease [Candidatus Enterocloster excrementipullorum]|uniref:Sugar ABC transporter permease n=1 Tax=Candidatus Enterocloster excrementipullorum TaxID=2838559 RepID=A0A9D2SHX7_9FIRM|nr:sugar ABC transporter permease [Candidatus Enterocloster excrementipullorum]
MKKQAFWRNIKVVPYLYILPNMILFMVFMIIPVFMALYYSFMDWKGIGDPVFTGLENYQWLFTDDTFWKSLWNTAYYTLATVPFIMVLALFLAMLLNMALPLKGVFRAAIYLPAVVSTVVVGMIFTWLFQDQVGLINYLLNLLGIESIQWANDPKFAMIMLVAATIWQRTGYNMVIYLAGLQGISQEYYEAAIVDGASNWQRFRYLTLPLLKTTHVFVMITCIIHSFRSFDLVYTMTKGGPLNSTKTMVMYIYELAFTRSQFGRASAAGVALFTIMVVLTAVRFMNNKAEE